MFVTPIAVGRILAIVAFILPRILKAKVRGEIYNHLLTMYYVSATKQRPSCGSLTLRLGDGQTLTGHQIYHDLANHELNTEPYELRQK